MPTFVSVGADRAPVHHRVLIAGLVVAHLVITAEFLAATAAAILDDRFCRRSVLFDGGNRRRRLLSLDVGHDGRREFIVVVVEALVDEGLGSSGGDCDGGRKLMVLLLVLWGAAAFGRRRRGWRWVAHPRLSWRRRCVGLGEALDLELFGYREEWVEVLLGNVYLALEEYRNIRRLSCTWLGCK